MAVVVAEDREQKKMQSLRAKKKNFTGTRAFGPGAAAADSDSEEEDRDSEEEEFIRIQRIL